MSKTEIMPSMAPLARYFPSGENAKDSVNLPLKCNNSMLDIAAISHRLVQRYLGKKASVNVPS